MNDGSGSATDPVMLAVPSPMTTICDLEDGFAGLPMVWNDAGRRRICIFQAGQTIYWLLIDTCTSCCKPNTDNYNLAGSFDNHPNSHSKIHQRDNNTLLRPHSLKAAER